MLSDKIRLNAFCHVDANGKWQKMTAKIIGWKRLRQDPNMIAIALDDNWQLASINAREHFIAKGWFATEDGRMLHYTERYGLNEVSPSCTLLRRVQKFHVTKNGVPGHYRSYIQLPFYLRHLLRQVQLHIFVYECWKGARKPGKQIDHLNGCELDNRIINLQEVTPEENRYRGIVLDSMRKAHNEDGTPKYDMELLEKEPWRCLDFFDKWRDLYRPKTKNRELKEAIKGDPAAIMDYELTHHME